MISGQKKTFVTKIYAQTHTKNGEVYLKHIHSNSRPIKLFNLDEKPSLQKTYAYQNRVYSIHGYKRKNHTVFTYQSNNQTHNKKNFFNDKYFLDNVSTHT